MFFELLLCYQGAGYARCLGFFEQCVGGVIFIAAHDFLRPAEEFHLTAYVAK